MAWVSYLRSLNNFFKLTTLCLLYKAWGRKRRVKSEREAME